MSERGFWSSIYAYDPASAWYAYFDVGETTSITKTYFAAVRTGS